MKKQYRYILVAIGSIIGFGAIYWATTSLQNPVTDFESCAEKTGVIQESFPRQCVYDGITYTEEINNPDEFVDLSLPDDERDFINVWIDANNLNQYGDPLDTVYMGGSPLFNETTGTSTPLYAYLIENHPNKPWLESPQTPSEDTSSERDNDVNESVEEEPESAEPLSFADVESWQMLEHPNFTLDYPEFAETQNGNDFPIRITTSDDFSFAVHAPVEPSGEGECVQSIELGVDGYIYLCHNNNTRYISIYQRMIDSILPR